MSWKNRRSPPVRSERTACAKAHAAGLRCRPVAETVRDTWAWLRDLPAQDRSFGRHGIDPEKEAAILAEWA
ncbi:hypothetical protein FHR32_000361 [Streptosporangium album]|uniref:Uncharacterized protein n=1 Tax=Streptosporangium album TaxID=47479 RepID=A0A7W7RR57_9ACTN|nr:hypothetical protein [Streptosporangium album]MBB4936056.1 hypothetical protein [Streptosporangium album]